MKRNYLRPVQQGMAVLTLCLPGAVGHAADSAGPLERLETWLASVETLSGTFDQRLLDESGQIMAQSAGTLTLKRPGLFRWHYTSPSELLVVSDGSQVFSYDVELDNVTVMEQGDALRGSPAALLAGKGTVADGYELAASYRADDVDWVELKPRGTQRDFRMLRLGLGGDRLVGMELHDQLGQITRLGFGDLKRNGPVDDELFVFEIPAGVDVIRGGEPAP